ncbi:hypothetical protein [Mycolicibacterium smegmatis]|uniref:hypothetical protein n=1 Tax=Mycolicibacterium smegmatis TaxID=1772 RepID=UPI001EFA3A54|nr:hypothetical protein [Mycolicibacterium smegmatis]ULN33554.1 hypothetical protein KZ781_22400 [Mycolicibacterium smegmatis]
MAINRHGTATRGDVLVNRLNDGTDLNEVWDEINDALTEYNRQKSALAGLLAFRTANVADAIPQGQEVPLLEEATEFGTPVGIADPTYLTLGYSFKDFDIASRMTWKYLREADSEQVTNRVARILAGDAQLVNGSILQRILDPTVRVNDWGHNCYGLYNADMKPPVYMGKTFADDHQHYLTTTTTTLDSLHVEAGINHVKEHGYGVNTGRFVLLMHPNDVQSSLITSWRAGKEYRTGGPLAKWDFVVSSNAPARITHEHVEGATPPPDYNGLPVLGSYGSALLIETYFMPAGYVIIAATGGPNGNDNVVGFREHKNAAYRGLRVIPGPGPFPIQEHFYARGFGTGVRHRGAAVAVQITASSSYTPPIIVAHR